MVNFQKKKQFHCAKMRYELLDYNTSLTCSLKYKRLVYKPLDLLVRSCKGNESNAKNSVFQDDCYFLGVHLRLSTRCKMFHSKITYPFPQKSHECALKLTDLWIIVWFKLWIYYWELGLIYLVYTKTVDSVFRALWLATQSGNILHYSLIHL